MNTFSTCGKILYVDSIPVAYAQFAPYHMLPQTKSYDDYQAEKNDIFLSCLFICEAKYRRMGLGSKLLKDIVSDLKIRGFNRIETFARRGSANNPSGPLEFYLKHGFEIKKELDRNFILVTLNLKD